MLAPKQVLDLRAERRILVLDDSQLLVVSLRGAAFSQ
jgi:hypothetical protein